MKYERLTTDKPQNNKDFLLNFAFVKDGEVYLRGMGDDGEEIRLCDYIAIRATSEKGCERTPQDILDGACNECHCELAALNIVAVQAVELRNRLAELEDKIKSDTLFEFPCKPSDIVYYVTEVDDGESIYYTILNGVVDCFNIETGCKEFLARYDGGLTYWHNFLDFGKKVFTDKSQAEARLKELQNEG